MACVNNSITELLRECNDGTLGGLYSEIYMIAYKDLKPVSSASTSTYTVNSANTVTAVGVVSGKTFVQVDLLKSTSGLVEKATVDTTKGTNFFTQTFSLVLSDYTEANINFIDTVKGQPVAIIMKTRTDKYLVIGLNGQLTFTALDGGTGTAEADQIGWTLTFEGNSRSVALRIQDSLVPTLL